MKAIRKLTSVLAASAVAAGTLAAFPAYADSAEKTPAEMTTAEFVRDMGIGINLGNTFESCGSWIDASSPQNFETAWGSPVITEDMIKGYKEEGFGVLRIPVAWSNMMAEDYTIDQAYIDRVMEVTQWALDADLYVIVNIHWDGGWLNNIPLNEEEGLKKYKSVWTQLCEAFKDVDERVMFESLNEELGVWADAGLWNQYSGTEGELKEKSYDLGNRINQLFVDTVRASGGYNADRHLLIAGFNTNIAMTSDPLYKMPTDPQNRCALSLHYYDPFNFTHQTASSWGSVNDYKLINDNMETVKTNFIDKGIPVIMGECGFGTELMTKTEGDAYEYLEAVIDNMYSRGICPVLWDINYSESDKREDSIYSRYDCKLTDPDYKQTMQKVLANGLKKSNEITAPETIDVYYNEPIPDIGAASLSGGKLRYSTTSSVISVDENGVISASGTGNATITVYSETTDEYLAAFKQVKVNIQRNPNPPDAPASSMTVGDAVKTTDDIPLADGWTWKESYTIPETGSVTAEAVYGDRNYTNRTVEVTISREKTSDTSSAADSVSSDTSSKTDSSSSTSAASSSAASSSAASSSSKASSSTASTAASSTAQAGEPSPNTGSAAAGLGLTAVILASIAVAKKKND